MVSCQRRGRCPVILLMSSAFAGPIPRAVMVPGGISVYPASTIREAGTPAISAANLSS